MTTVLKFITNTSNFLTTNDKTKTQKWPGVGVEGLLLRIYLTCSPC
jgi:hypothetical protein